MVDNAHDRTTTFTLPCLTSATCPRFCLHPSDLLWSLSLSVNPSVFFLYCFRLCHKLTTLFLYHFLCLPISFLSPSCQTYCKSLILQSKTKNHTQVQAKMPCDIRKFPSNLSQPCGGTGTCSGPICSHNVAGRFKAATEILKKIIILTLDNDTMLLDTVLYILLFFKSVRSFKDCSFTAD